MCTTEHEGHLNLLHSYYRGASLLGPMLSFYCRVNSVGCLHPHPINIYIKGCRRSKGQFVHYTTCIQPKISLAVYIWGKIGPVEIWQGLRVIKLKMVNSACSQLCCFFFLYHFFCQGWRGRETKLIYKDVLVYTIFFTLFFS